MLTTDRPARSGGRVSDEQLMRFALNRAREAWQRGEVPVGAIVLLDGEIAGEGFNQPIATARPDRARRDRGDAPGSRAHG